MAVKDLGADLGNGRGGRRRTALAIAAALPLALLLACGGEEAPPSPEGAAPPTPVAKAEPATPPTPAAKGPADGVKVVRGEIPAGYPADLPQPPSAEPETALMVEGKGGIVSFKSTETSQAVVDHFTKSLPEQGWQVASTSGDAARSTIKATKDTRAVTVIVSQAPSGTGSSVVVQVK